MKHALSLVATVLGGAIAFTGVFACQAQAQNPLTNGLVAYYPLNGSLLDAVRPTNTAVIVSGGFTQGRLGLPETALYLDGSPNGGVRITNDAIPVSFGY